MIAFLTWLNFFIDYMLACSNLVLFLGFFNLFCLPLLPPGFFGISSFLCCSHINVPYFCTSPLMRTAVSSRNVWFQLTSVQ